MQTENVFLKVVRSLKQWIWSDTLGALRIVDIHQIVWWLMRIGDCPNQPYAC